MKNVLIIALAVAVFSIAATPTYADDAHHPQTIELPNLGNKVAWEPCLSVIPMLWWLRC